MANRLTTTMRVKGEDDASGPIGDVTDSLKDLGQAAYDTTKWIGESTEAYRKRIIAFINAEQEGIKAALSTKEALGKVTTGMKGLQATQMATLVSTQGITKGLLTLGLTAAGVPVQIAALLSSFAKIDKWYKMLGRGLLALAERIPVFGKMVKGLRLAVTWTAKLARGFISLGRKVFPILKKIAGLIYTVFKKALGAAISVVKTLVGWVGKLASSLLKLGGGILVLLGLSGILQDLRTNLEEVLTGAISFPGINAAFKAIAGEGAPAMLAALKKGSAFMVDELDLLKSYNQAYLLIGKTIADQLPDAYLYLTKIALATGKDMGYLIDSLIRGVGRLSPRVLDNLDIQVSLAEVVAYATVEFGKQAEQLSVNEKQSAMYAVAMEKLEAKTAGLFAVEGSLYQLRAWAQVQQKENTRALVTHFLPAIKSFYQWQIKVGESIRKSISEGGRWYNTLRKISAAATAMFQVLADLPKLFGKVGADSVDAFANKMFEAAWKAFSWGVNIANNLAIGIVRGAATAIIAAINYISNILAYWMAPGSAPRFASDILAWGSETFAEWLKGFTEGDFGALRALQVPLRAALDNLAALGMMAEEAVAPTYMRLTQLMAEALDHFRKTGEVTTEVLAQLAAVGGGYGEHLVELFRRQLAVAAAVEAVAAAERRLLAARNLEEASGKRLTRQAREYNRLLLAGADPAILAAKLAEMKASYATLEAAREEAELAEEARNSAREQAKEANRLARLQAELLQQLIDMARAREEALGLEAPAEGIVEPLIGALGGAIDSIDQAFIDLTERIRARFQALIDQIALAWETSGIHEMLDELKKRWEESELKVWFDEFILDVSEEGLRAALSNLWLKLAPTIQLWLDDKVPWLGNIWRGFTEEGIEDGSGKVSFSGALAALRTEVVASIQGWLDRQIPWLGRVWRAFTEEGLEDGSGKVDFAEAVRRLWKIIKEGLNDLAFNFGVWMGKWLVGASDDMKEDGTSLAESFVNGLKEGFDLKQWFLNNVLRGLLETSIGALLTWLRAESPSGRFRDIGRDMIQGLINGLWSKGWQVSSTLSSIVQNAINNIRNLLGWWSPSKLFIEMGEDLLEGLGIGALAGSKKASRAITDATRAALGGVAAASTGGRGAGGVTIIQHFGPGSIRSNKDIRDAADQAARSARLYGVRAAI